MQVCHSFGVVHRDLKLENVLFDSMAKNKIKVVDFGIAGIVTNTSADQNTAATLKYMTPEMINDRNSVAAPPMDVWAIGIMTYCMLFYRYPFRGETREQTKQLITSSEYEIPKSVIVSPDVLEFLGGCLHKDPTKRMTLKQLLELPWMRKSEEEIEQMIQDVKDGKLKAKKIASMVPEEAKIDKIDYIK